MEEDLDFVVSEIGSYNARIGFHKDDAPRCVFASAVGRPKHRGVMVGMGRKDSYVGDEALAKHGILNIKYPVEGGEVVNFDDLEKIWHSAFYNELRVAPEEHGIVLVVSPLTMRNSKHMSNHTQIMFETFNVPLLTVTTTAQAAAYACDLQDVIVVESGHGLTYAVPVVGGAVDLERLEFVACGGGNITTWLASSLAASQGTTFETVAKMLCVRGIKEKLSYVALNGRNSADPAPVTYTMPDNGPVLKIGREQFMAPELLFSARAPPLDWNVMRVLLAGRKESSCELSRLPRDLFVHIISLARRRGVHDLVRGVLERDGVDRQKMETLLLTGGNTLFKGLVERIRHELPFAHIIAPENRHHLAWIGAAKMARDPNTKWVTKDIYDEYGPGECWKHTTTFIP